MQWLQQQGTLCAQVHWRWLWICIVLQMRHYTTSGKTHSRQSSFSLCYGEEEASGKYWCDICERETDPKKWFYTCKDQRVSLHTRCVLGDSTGFMPRSVTELWGKSYEVVLNNSVTRPFCIWCRSRCMYPIYFKFLGNSVEYICSIDFPYILMERALAG